VETSIEVRYAGVVVGRTAHAREVEARGGRGEALFLGISEPLPVGTLVTLKIGDVVREARVDEVVEAADPSAVGMRVVFDTAAGAFDAAAPPKAVAAPAPVVAAAPVAASNADASDAAPSGDDSPSAAVAAESEASEAISAPLSLAGPSGGGKKRRKRR
jgi:hypothetical protein